MCIKLSIKNSMNFFCISTKKQKITRGLLKKSAEERGLKFINIDVNNFDTLDKKYQNNEGVLYRITSGELAKNIELFLLQKNNLETFYKTNKRAFFNALDIPLQKFYNISMPKTVTILSDNYETLKAIVEEVGGFPVILKVTGLSHGAGVMKMNSMESLISVIGFLKKNGATRMVLREYIDSYRHARLVVLGDKVVDSIEYIVPENDFRTNAGKPQVKAEKFSDDFEKIAIEAIKIIDLEFGGVDILIGKDSSPYLAEVNFPCYFPRNQLTTGVDISGMMVEYLVDKFNKKNEKDT